jgi:hypothetical protein
MNLARRGAARLDMEDIGAIASWRTGAVCVSERPLSS